jgi:hypothetical protein
MSQCLVEPARTSRALPFAWNVSLVPLCAAIGIAGYFTAAFWLQRSWHDPRPNGQVVVPLVRPFEPLGKSAFRVALPREYSRLGTPADRPDVEGDARSPVVVYEGKSPLGPSHSTFAQVSAGSGHFAHWADFGLVFSASDGTDPNSNGRRYWAVIRGSR